MGVSKNRGTPKWMVKKMENPMNKWMIWGENPIILGNTHIFFVFLDAFQVLFFVHFVVISPVEQLLPKQTLVSFHEILVGSLI